MAKVSKYVNGNLLSGRTYTQADVAVTSNDGLAGFSVTAARFVPYQTTDGTWRLKFNFRVTFTSTSISGGGFSIAGVVFADVGSFNQPCAGMYTGVTTTATFICYTEPNTDDIITQKTGASNNTRFQCSGDVELASKPTWVA